ncbi:MFS transporter [Streptomyces sp. JL4002]|uniref:MFS transporter n=1 Tax=Streptomyces sp. JL4002 TaxID=3404781 RepID=UPI003B288A58
MLIAARVVQGLAAALIAPRTMALIVHLFPAERRGRALGVWGAVGGAAMAAGPVIGGLLITWAGWRGIFLVNIPVGVIGWIAAARLLPDWPAWSPSSRSSPSGSCVWRHSCGGSTATPVNRSCRCGCSTTGTSPPRTPRAGPWGPPWAGCSCP